MKYYEAGYIVLPIEPETKAAKIKSWNTIFTKEMTSDTVEQYCESHGDWGIGLVCGKASNIAAADFDWVGEHHEIYERMILGALPLTQVVKMGSKKWTRFYQNHESLKLKHIKWQNTEKNFFDLLSDGPGYTILPPSLHKEGMLYRWVTEESLLDVKADELPFITDKHVATIEEIAKLDLQIIHMAAQRRSTRNDTLFGFVWHRSDTAKTFEDLVQDAIKYDGITHANEAKGPYFSDKKYRKEKSAIDFATQEISRWLSYKTAKKSAQGISWSVGADADFETKANGFLKKIVKRNQKGSAILDDSGGQVFYEKPDYDGLAQYMRNAIGFKSSDFGNYIFNGKCYEYLSDLALRNKCDELTLNKYSPAQIAEAINAIQYKSYVSEKNITEPIGQINMQNGVLDIKTKNLLPHDKSMFFKYVLPHSYDPDAKCPTWLEFLDFIFEGEQALADLSSEIFGYILAGGNPWLHKAFFLSGSGRNGKSTWLGALKGLIGKPNFSSVQMKNLGKPFSVVMMDGVLANIVGELDDKELSSEAFKIAVGGEELTAAQKGKPEYQLTLTCRLVFAMNNPPHFKDASAGNYERLCILPFNRYIPANDRDASISDRISLELPGILNWALDGLERLKARGRLPKISVVDDALAEYRSVNDSVYDWVQNRIAPSEKENCYVLGDFYKGYAEWCKADGRYPFSKNWFVRNLMREVKSRMPNMFTEKPKNKLKIKGRVILSDVEINTDT